MNRIVVNITLAAAAAMILAIPAAAQGHSEGHSGGGSAAAGSMGGGGHKMDVSEPSGPRTADQMLLQNKQLSTKLSSLLPAGTDLQAAAMGYSHLGQFVSAVHVSHNLGIPFAQLKCAELATTQACPNMAVPAKGSHLGQAIQTLKPTMTSAESKAAAKKAESEASADTHQ